MKTLEQFLLDYLGKSKGYPTDKEYLGECLSIAKIYIKECFGINPPPSGTNSAYGYWSNFPNPLGEKFEKVLNTDDLIPEKGWIAIWKPWASNPYGHIAIVADGCATGTLKNYAQNWTSKIFQLESNRYTNVIGFLKPIINSDETMTDEQKRILDFIGTRTEGDVREAFGALSDQPNKDEQIRILNERISFYETKIKELESTVDVLNRRIEDYSKTIDDWQSDFRTANEQVTSLTEQLGTKSTDVSKYRKLYENYNNLTGWGLIIIGIKKLFIK
jgi:prefoldin subunit 5